MTRGKLDGLMNDVHKELVEMGELIERALRNASGALKEANVKKTEKTSKLEHEIDLKEAEIEKLCLNILLTQQPVAGDLRLVLAALKMITDMERIGDQARDMAVIALTLDRSCLPCVSALENMFEQAASMVGESINAFVASDLDMATAVFQKDEAVNRCFSEIYEMLAAFALENPHHVKSAFDLLVIARYIERIGDHACNIGEWVVYVVKGERV